jgi:hypothetical protein
VYWLFVEDYFLSSFSPLRNASAGSFEMKAPFNKNPSPQSGDVIVNPINPENPDSKTNGCCAHNFQRRQDRWYSV